MKVEISGHEHVNGAVVLLSGGMDSSTLLFHVKRLVGRGTEDGRRKTEGETEDGRGEVRALSFRYGQKHGARELEAAAWQARAAGVAEHRVVDVSFFGQLASASALTGAGVAVPDLADVPEAERDQPPTYVPNRNMTLLAMAAAYAESVGIFDVFYGAQASDRYGYWDCTAEFLERINAVLALNRRTPVRIHAPFVGLSKAQVLKIGLELGVDYGHTWTCYRGGAKPCGTCPSCVERREAFDACGRPDEGCGTGRR